MTWVRLDDGFADHPKVIGLSDKAFRLHVKAMCYCGKHLTDGYLPPRWASGALVKELIRNGNWEEVDDGGFFVHDFLDYNPTREDVLGEREQARERMANVRANRWENIEGSSNTPSRPVPRKNLESTSFIKFWEIYPRKVGKRTSQTAFIRATERASADAIIEGAARLAKDPNLPDVQFIPHPTTWLNRDGWEDDPLPPRTGGKARQVSNILALADRMENDER